MTNETLKEYMIREFVTKQDSEIKDKYKTLKYIEKSGYRSCIKCTDIINFYHDFKNEIWQMLEEDKNAFGSKNIMEFISTFNCAKIMNTDHDFMCNLVYYAAERTASKILQELKENQTVKIRTKDEIFTKIIDKYKEKHPNITDITIKDISITTDGKILIKENWGVSHNMGYIHNYTRNEETSKYWASEHKVYMGAHCYDFILYD